MSASLSVPTLFKPTGKALTTPFLDFLMVGGISLGFALYTYLYIPTSEAIAWAGMLAFYLAFFINQPHFMYSYMLIYDRFWHKATDSSSSLILRARYWFAGVIAPLVMAAYMIYYIVDANPTNLSYLINLMFFLVGWHYVKQGFGVLVVLSVYQRIFFSAVERWVLLINAFFVWLMSWVMANSSINIHDYYAIMFLTFAAPSWFSSLVWYGFIGFGAATAIVFVYQLAKYKGRISWNGWVGYVCASYLWIYLTSQHYLYGLFFPLFHSLQYFPFVFRYKFNQLKEKGFEWSGTANDKFEKLRPLIVFAIGGGVLGYAMFYAIPLTLNETLYSYWSSKPELAGMYILGPQVFTFAFILFINVHHYFIDNVIWRKDNAETRKYLFGFQRGDSKGSDVTTSPSPVASR